MPASLVPSSFDMVLAMHTNKPPTAPYSGSRSNTPFADELVEAANKQEQQGTIDAQEAELVFMLRTDSAVRKERFSWAGVWGLQLPQPSTSGAVMRVTLLQKGSHAAPSGSRSSADQVCMQLPLREASLKPSVCQDLARVECRRILDFVRPGSRRLQHTGKADCAWFFLCAGLQRPAGSSETGCGSSRGQWGLMCTCRGRSQVHAFSPALTARQTPVEQRRQTLPTAPLGCHHGTSVKDTERG